MPKHSIVFIMAHGAGAHKDSDWLLQMDQLLSNAGIIVERFNFPYMIQRVIDGTRRPPDRQPKLLAAFEAQIQKMAEKYKDQSIKLVIGGKSMGGRMASLLVAEYQEQKKLGEVNLSSQTNQVKEIEIAAVICFGFPFHPPKKLDKYRGDHLVTMQTSTLILQGERDTLGTKQEISSYQYSDLAFSNRVRVEYLPDGDHSFKPRVKSGFTLEQNMQTASEQVINYLFAI